MSVFPPEPVPARNTRSACPQIDADGNAIAGLRYPDIEVPLGTYNGWSLRKAGYAEGEQWWNTGSFVPFARTRAEREANGDPRPSIEERYAEPRGLRRRWSRRLRTAGARAADAAGRRRPLHRGGAEATRWTPRCGWPR